MTISISEAIRAEAIRLGFDVCGISDAAAPWDSGARLTEFVEQGRHGAMDWMETTLERRSHPRAMWPDARSAIMLGVNYGPDADPLAALADRSRGAVSVYAHGEDYHEPIKKRLKVLAGWIASTYGAQVKVFVDTAPLMEKPLAQQAGLGWQGKHTNLVSRQFGSWLFLGSVLTDLELAPDAPSGEHCGACTACLDICPTNAFPAPFQLDARRCLAYLNNEFAGPFPMEFRVAMGNRIYGCDDCLAVCPWNKFAAVAREARFHARDALRGLLLADLAELDDAAFRALFSKSPVKRIGRDRFIRNVLYALGNSGDPALMAAVQPRLNDASPLVRGAAVWAAWRLLDAAAFSGLGPHDEHDADVLAEWAYGAAANQSSKADQAAGSVSIGA
jgi:epoxyqueuosine reductase